MNSQTNKTVDPLTILIIGGSGFVTGTMARIVVESRAYYHVLGRLLEREVTIDEVPTADFLAEHPDKAPFCCDRVYDLTALQATGLQRPATPLESGLRLMFESLVPTGKFA